VVLFDVDDIDAAFEELDARYVVGEASAHTHMWSVITGGYAALNRHEIPPTTPDWISTDHRRGGSAFVPGDLATYIRVSWEDSPENTIHVEAVHRLNELGAVVTSTTRGVSVEGFYAEWREIDVVTFDGDMINGTELFDAGDLDVALARFDELGPPAPRLENLANHAAQRFQACFAARDWDTAAKVLADDTLMDDRRPLVGAGARRGGEVLADWQAIADVGVKTVSLSVIATRGECLALCRCRFSGRDQRPEAYHTDALAVVEANADGRVVAQFVFDLDDIDSAFEELDARYLAGDAAAHAQTWSVVAGAYAALCRHELPPTTRDWVNVDHRHVAGIEAGDLTAWIRAMWDVVPNIAIHVESVHRLNEFGAVVTDAAYGSSQQGFDAEWRELAVVTVDGDLISRCEKWDGADLDVALARFDELSTPATQLENAASRVTKRFNAYFAAPDWAAMAEMVAEDMVNDDRRPLVGAGVRVGRDAEIANVEALVDIGVTNAAWFVVATRGERLALGRVRISGRDQRPEAFHTDVLGIVEIDTDSRIAARVWFELDDIDSAIAELEARYLAGEAASCARTWSVLVGALGALNRHEVPPTTTDFVDIDHRRVANIDAGGMKELLRTALEVTPVFSSYVEKVHRLTDLGVVATQVAHGTSQEGFDAEWRTLQLLTVEGDLIDRCEVFDEADLDAALARFDELSRPEQLENAASRVDDRFEAHFAARDWDGMAGLLADEICVDDRRRVVNAGIRRGRDAEIASLRAMADLGVREGASATIATRGERLALSRNRFVGRDQRPEAFRTEMLCIIEIDQDERIVTRVSFDLDDIDAAFEELDARYLAGEAAAHGQTWSVVAGAFARVNRHEMPAFTPDWVNVDHRHAIAVAPGEMTDYIHASLIDAPDMRVYIEAVHRLSSLGVVLTVVAHNTSQQGFDAEWRLVAISTVEGERISRCEMFDEADLDAALARFDELSQQAPPMENAATRAEAPLADAFNRRDLDGFVALYTEDGRYEDRRKGLRDAGTLRSFATAMLSLAPPGWRIEIEHVAIRGDRWVMCRNILREAMGADRPIAVETLTVAEVTADGLVDYTAIFDPDDLDSAMAELTSRWMTAEEIGHPDC
jgi:ketosteroid isomerase-like protein